MATESLRNSPKYSTSKPIADSSVLQLCEALDSLFLYVSALIFIFIFIFSLNLVDESKKDMILGTGFFYFLVGLFCLFCFVNTVLVHLTN